MKRFLALFCLLVLNISLSHAAVTITFSEVGPDVVAVSSGTINTAGFDSLSGFGPLRGFVGGTGIQPSLWCDIGLGLPVGRVDAYAISNWSNDNTDICNTGTQKGSLINSGDFVGFFSRSSGTDGVYVPLGYVSGEPISGTSTWPGNTITSLDLIPGTYEYTWGTGDDADSLTLIVPADTTNPTLQSSTPADNATGVSIAAPTLSLVFDEPVSYASGLIRMYRTSDDVEINNRSVSGSTGSGTPNISISFENALALDTEYYVLIPAGAFEDAAGNPYAGIDSTTALSFSTGVPSTPTYSVGGTIAGKSGSVTLQNNGGDDIIKDAFDNSDFTFPAQAEGSSYSVSVSSQPFGQTCTVTNGSGTIGSADVTNISVTCEDTRLLGGFMIGVVSGGSITLQNNGADDFTWLENPITSYRFPTRVPVGASWNVTVLTPPTGQTCTVSNAVGTMGNSNFTDVDVTCVSDVVPAYSVGGTVSGLTGTGLELENIGADTLPVAAAATAFTFATELEVGVSYVVTVSTQPTGQTCIVSNGSGTISDANITDVAVTCADNPSPEYTINVAVSGLGPNGVTLQNNGADDLDVDANGPFVFATALPDGSTYDVTVLTQPTGQTCDVTNGFGKINGSDVVGVDVDCVDDVVAPPTPTVPIPTLSEWALILLTMLLGLMVFANRRRLF